MRVSIMGNLSSQLVASADVSRGLHSMQSLAPLAEPATACSDHAAVHAPAIEPQATASPGIAPLKLSLHGLTADERSVLMAILRVLSERTTRRWVVVDAEQEHGDLRLATRTLATTASSTMTALLLREDEFPASPDELALQAPLRVMAVLDLLNAAHDRLRQPLHVPVTTQEHQAIESDDGKSLAAAMARQIERRADVTLRVRIVGHGTLYLCMKQRIYHCDFPREKLVDALNEHRFVMTMIAASAAELVVLLDQARPVDEALWQIGLVTSAERTLCDNQAYRLTRWPDLARLAHRPEAMKLCASMARSHQTLDRLVEVSGLRRGDVEHLLHACALCGYLDVADAAVAPPAPPASPVRNASAIGGLFDRLRRRFGL